MKLSDFTYELPTELIARYPLSERRGSRLLCLNGSTGELQHRQFIDVVELCRPGDLLVCNNSRVIPARLFGQKATGGVVEVLIERIVDTHRALAHVRASKSPKPGSVLYFAEGVELEVVGRQNELFELRIKNPPQPPFFKGGDTMSAPLKKGGEGGFSILSILQSIGEIPLPPYFHRSPEESDKERYQTVFAEHDGSVAAPTAGLHFDNELINQLRSKGIDIDYVTLHVGAGTFAPVRVENIEQHRMHAEYIEVSAELCKKITETKQRGGRIIAVGTTSARSLETASRSGQIQPFSGDTDIFIYPGFTFNCVDALITNFHLPGSTLMMLVSAFGGYDNIMHAYQNAVSQKYRFFSYGDAMFINRRT